MYKRILIVVCFVFSFIIPDNAFASVPDIQQVDQVFQKDSLVVGSFCKLPLPISVRLVHSHRDSVNYIQNDTVFKRLIDPLARVQNVGVRYMIRGVKQSYGDAHQEKDSLQHAIGVLLEYAKNDSIRHMVNYLRDYLEHRDTDDALRIVKKKIERDSIMSYDPESSEDPDDIQPWREEALTMLYDYIEKDSVNLWLREVNRDSVEIGLRNVMNDSLKMWVNNGRGDYKRFWLKKNRRDSIGIWIQNAPNSSIRIFVDDDVYQESVQKTRKKGARVPLKEIISDQDYKLAKIAKRERLHQIWKTGSEMGMAFNQGHVNNWAGGGESSVSTLTTVKMHANYKKGKSQWDNTLDIRYGVIKSGDQSFRKNEDKFELNTKYGQKAYNKWFYSAMFNMKTQLFRGFEYPGDKPKRVSSFLAPGYFLFSVGMDYKPKAGFSILLSPITGKWTYVRDTVNINQTKYGVDEDKRVKKETGAYVKLVHKWKITSDIVMNNKLDLYSSYNNRPENVDIDWQMDVVLQVNQYIQTKISTHVISDKDTGSKIQFKENLSVGVRYWF